MSYKDVKKGLGMAIKKWRAQSGLSRQVLPSKDARPGEALRLGAEACIAKPVDSQRLSELIPRLDLSWRLG
jgi:hypothetical protein